MSDPSLAPRRSQPLFSIVTVCLNACGGLIRAGESLHRQQFDSWEWLIKDGGSKDGTSGDAWSDPRVKFVSRKDEGVFDAMNQALEHCGGEYVFFLNTGDLFCSTEALAKVAAFISEAGRPEVVYTYYEYVEPGNVLKYPGRLTPGYLYRRSVCHQATFIRRDCFQRYGVFDPAMRVGADDEFLARLVLKERVRHMLCPVPVVRIEEWNYSARAENRGWEERAREYIRQEYLTPFQRLRGRFCYAATLPGLRRRWYSLPKTSRSYRLYVAVSNFLNQHV